MLNGSSTTTRVDYVDNLELWVTKRNYFEDGSVTHYVEAYCYEAHQHFSAPLVEAAKTGVLSLEGDDTVYLALDPDQAVQVARWAEEHCDKPAFN